MTTGAMSFRAVVAAELIKIRTVRATYWTLLLTPVVSAGLGYLIGLSANSAMSAGRRLGPFDPGFITFYGILLGQIPLVVFMVLLVGGEYSSGTINASLAAVPRRGLFYGGKIAAVALVAFPVSLVTTAAIFVSAQIGLGPHHVTLATDGMARAAVGACLYLTLIGLLAAGVTATLRSSVISLGVLLPLLFLGSQGLGNAPGINVVAQYLPDQAGSLIIYTLPLTGNFARSYGAWTGVAILAAWAAAALVAGLVATRRR
ncbi:hypothetical protein [Sphaerisporangium aureirubrum]|uniref:ABC transporter permease n=1 Tax=Sphaerisporangium aureirubrum TaxID=1544736 RepID=A0ABW1NBH4_9ACTN